MRSLSFPNTFTLSPKLFFAAVSCCVSAFLTSAFLISAFSAPCRAQEVLDRSQRSPWRASFTEVSPQAIQANESNADRAPLNANPAVGAAQLPARSQSQSTSLADTVPRLNLGSTTPTSNGALNDPRSGANASSSLQSALETKVTRTQSQLPNAAGQVWREYDISPYTENVGSDVRPQQAILDWVLRETGTEMWFNEPLGILNATKDRLIVYHTPEIQAEVKAITDRFVRTRGQEQNFNIDLLTVGNPNWRSNAYSLLQTIDVQTPGVEAWMMSKENAAILIGQLRQRADFKPHSGGEVKTHDGQSFVLEKTKPVQFIRSLRWLPGQFPVYEPLMTTINEGYTLSISSLSLLDNRAIEVAIKCDVDQVETLTPIKIPVAGAAGSVQSAEINVPELISWRLHERFRWPSDQVLLLSCGVVADPQPETTGGTGVFGLKNRRKQTNRSDALLLIEYRGPATGANLPRTAGRSSLAPLK